MFFGSVLRNVGPCFRHAKHPKNPQKTAFKHIGVSFNGGTLGKPMVVGYHHFRKPPYQTQYPPRKLQVTYPAKRQVRNIIDSKVPIGSGYV